ncbi:MAG: DUF4163 domain-containing protein [Saprospiraceae bacterium]
MRIFPSVLILILCYCTISCHQNKSRPNDGQGLFFELNSYQKQTGDCNEASPACARVDIKYPVAKGPNQAACQAINDSILNLLIQNLAFEGFEGQPTKASLVLAVDAFLNEWNSNKVSDPAATTGWEVTINGEGALRTSKVAAASFTTYSYAGGAHPNSFVTILNFDQNTGRQLEWGDIVTDTAALLALAEKHFKKTKGLPLATDIMKAGYFWDEGFKLPQNFEIQNEGIYFWYNPYETAAYSDGPTDFLIPYQELGNLVRKEVIFVIKKNEGS